jgi:AraC-like DNA-binding protein
MAFSPHLFYIGQPFFFLAAPSFYLYVKSLAFSDFTLNKRHLFHAMPFLFMVLLFTVTYHIHSAETKRALLESNIFFLQSFGLYFNLIVYIYILGYNLSSLFILRNYRKRIKEEYSSIERINLSWLSFILYGFIFACCTSIIAGLSFAFDLRIRDNLILINLFSFFVLFNYIFFKALVQPSIFSGIEERQRQKPPFLSKSLELQYLNQLSTFMDAEKPYLNPDITLSYLSEKVFIPHRALSEIINNSLDQNFYDFINSYRIKESQRLLKNQANKQKTVLEILYQVGYNSKSSFHIAFKKYTGMTPSQFKKLQ